jgi:hypothetical protein
MKVKIDVKDRYLDIQEAKEYEFQDYFDYLSRRTKSLLYLAENYKLDLVGHDILKKAVLDLAGHLKRLPQTLEFDEEV